MPERATDTLAEQLAAFSTETLRHGAPADVRASVRQRVLDVLGLQLAALDLQTSQAAIGYVREQGGVAQAHIAGTDGRYPAAWAAFANGVLAHSLDYDDTHLPSVLHPSASVVPAALAVAELSGADGTRLLDAIAVGIETVVRVGMAGYDRERRNSVYFEHGQHATSICGALGAGVAATLLLGGGDDEVVHSIGVAASMASGILEANRTGGTVKRLHCGWAAHAGVAAASLVSRGFTGPPTVLEGRFGFLEAFLQGAGRPAEITAGLGERWEVPGIFFKPYPANHFTHTGLDAARRLRADGLQAEDIVAAELGVAGPTVRTIGEPIEGKRVPRTGYEAQFSGPYMVALGFLGGHGLGAGLADFTDEVVAEPDRRALMARISVVSDPECEAIYPNQFPSVLRVRTRDGGQLEERVLVNRGGPDDPLSAEELELKFAENAGRALSPDEVAALAGAVRQLGVGPHDGGVADVAISWSRPRSHEHTPGDLVTADVGARAR
ncbi:MAG: MmgE/PrpD family protein [Nitriliruptor sp.]|nr:MAG: MmgE/PrpD family protein [Nitriliruptor sp.]